ncbi:neoverrucotoxin subunit alpha-like [Clinocottus analis]|uniref:neoverrucotoxin subunit alpha-like n=1 Tax=Clinocottus analis TaxID=304258 RepID=UPI0035BF0BD3
MDSEIKIAALGRPFTVGMLYDACRDELIPGLSLWDAETLKGKIQESIQPSSQFQITTSDTIASKSSMLDVEASLKASFLSGLIEVGGSGKYMNHQKKFKNQSRVTCQYKSTTNFKQLSGIDGVTADADQINIIMHSGATHVVTGILYGANAFFVFDSEKIDASNVQKIEGKMEAVINKIPELSVDASAGIKLTDAEKALTDTCSCKFIGDFILESNPATYVDAVKTYVQLPHLLGDKGENSVPMKIWLIPLNNLYPEAAELTYEITFELVELMQNALQDLSEMRMRCNDSLEGGVVENFLILQEQLETFQKWCQYFALKLQKTMKKMLPSIRKGKEDESSAEKVFEDIHNSPFSHERLSQWLDGKEREINIIKSCMDMMEGVKFVRNQSELDREVLAVGHDNVLCYVFTSMKRRDVFLDEMAAYLGSPEEGTTIKEEPWFYSPEAVNRMRAQAKTFSNASKDYRWLSSYSFFITVLPDDGYKGGSTYYYINGNLVNHNGFPNS